MAWMSMRIEFLGLPGVGKSELSLRVARRLAALDAATQQPSHALDHELAPVWRRTFKAIHVLRELACHPVASLQAARIIAATRQRRFLTHCLLTFNWLLVAGLARRAHRRPGVHVFDQGMLQAVWSVALEGDAETAMKLLRHGANHGFMPEVAVVVDADTTTVRHRLVERDSGASRIERDLAHANDLLERGGDIVRQIRDRLQGGAGPYLIVLHNEAEVDPERLADSLAADLRQLAVVEVQS
jgi:hypothetical protein